MSRTTPFSAPLQTRRLILILSAGLFVLLVSGAIAALGSHLMPSQSLLEGLRHDLQPDVHLAVRLRLLHPMIGLLFPLALWLTATYGGVSSPSSPFIAALQRHLYLAVFTAVLIGILTLGLLAPPWLKLLHLTMANVLVILAARLAFYSLRK